MQLMFIATNALLKKLAACYAEIADEISGKWIGIGFAKPPAPGRRVRHPVRWRSVSTLPTGCMRAAHNRHGRK
ncbi:MAG: hypothetical protein M5R42_17970 [Rhodocyclaceae bacterium]|nr:hypothetical protein [Rhodocyclaceae bacterium]